VARSDEVEVYDCIGGISPIALRVYYGESGGSVFSVVGGLDKLLSAWQIAPNYKVAFVCLYFDEVDANNWTRIKKLKGKDLYSFDGKKFYCGNDSRKMKGRLLFGQWFDKDEMRKLNLAARYVRRKWPIKEGDEIYA